MSFTAAHIPDAARDKNFLKSSPYKSQNFLRDLKTETPISLITVNAGLIILSQADIKNSFTFFPYFCQNANNAIPMLDTRNPSPRDLSPEIKPFFVTSFALLATSAIFEVIVCFTDFALSFSAFLYASVVFFSEAVIILT